MAGILGAHDVSLVQDKGFQSTDSSVVLIISVEMCSDISRSSVWGPRQAIVVAGICGVHTLGSGVYL